jgi:hypothetical protein
MQSLPEIRAPCERLKLNSILCALRMILVELRKPYFVGANDAV